MSTLEAKKREKLQKSYLTQIRGEGNFPAVIYGKGMDSEPVYINEGDFLKTIKEVGRNGVISMELNGSTHNVILHDYQQNPIKNQLIHADFFAVDLSSEVTAEVKVVLEGEASGAKEGGVVQQPLFELTVTAKVSEFPESVAVDISSLGIGDSISVGAVRGNYSFEIKNEDEETIVSVLAPRVEDGADDTEDEEKEAEAEAKE